MIRREEMTGRDLADWFGHRYGSEILHNIQWYLVQWAGWPRKRDWTWQSEDDLLPGSKQLLDTYKQKKDITGGKRHRRKTRQR